MIGHSLLKEQAYSFRELATLIGAGVPLVQALNDQLNRPMSHDLRRFFAAAARGTAEGRKLSEAMRQFPNLLSEITVALVEAGEQSGRLEEMLKDIAGYMERELELRNMISRETFYAKILVGAALFIPVAARAIIAWLMQNLWAAVVVLFKALLLYALLGGLPLALLYLVYRRFVASETGKNSVDAAKLALPGIGGIVERVALAKFARAFAALYTSGVAIVNAVPMAARACGNRHLATQMNSAVPKVEKGVPLSEALVGTRMTNSLLMRLLQTGEQSGNIDDMMTKAAQHYEDEAHTQIRKVAVAIVPIVIIIMGIIVGVMIVRFYLSFYEGIMGP